MASISDCSCLRSRLLMSFLQQWAGPLCSAAGWMGKFTLKLGLMGVGASINVDAQQKLGSRFNGRKRWPLHVRCRRKKFTFAISSLYGFLVCRSLHKMGTVQDPPNCSQTDTNNSYIQVHHTSQPKVNQYWTHASIEYPYTIQNNSQPSPHFQWIRN